MNANIAQHLPEMARLCPERIAVVAGTGQRDQADKMVYSRLSFAELDRASDAYAWGLRRHGFAAGQRVLLMVRPGLELLSLTFALFKVGCIPILIDPAMGRQNLAVCIAECQPEGFVGIPLAHVARLLFRNAFRTVQRQVTVGRRWFWGGPTLDALREERNEPYPVADVAPDAMAAIAFTTGSTGVPKGVVYEHGMFNAQIDILRDLYGVQPDEVDMPAFPLFALFNVALGTTSAIPDMDATRPASVDPRNIVEIIKDQRVTYSFGSPAIWNRVTRYCVDQRVTLPSLRRVFMAGAPVPPYLHERFERILTPEANTYTPYGATEALPVASISGRDVLAILKERSAPTAGTCVGRPIPQVTMRIISINDEAIPEWGESLVLPPNTVGEIAVKGPMVTKTYYNRPESTRLAKIREGDAIWHRMGDLGYFDDEGRLWFYGRKTQRVVTPASTFFTEPCELVFNQHPHVYRSALIGVRRQGLMTPMIVIEPEQGKMPKNRQDGERFAHELGELGAKYEMTRLIRTILFHPSFPVDIRHNAKIFREKLAVWAEKQVNSKS